MHLIEADKFLSQSLLWEIQRRYFLAGGVAPWQDDVVPSDISANPTMARAYRQIAAGYLRDCLRADAAFSFDAIRPIYIIELGAGAGRLAHHFLHDFYDWLAASPMADLDVVYVMTDFVPATLDFWRQHPRLQAWVQRGLLDFALFDATEPRPLTLAHAGITLDADQLINPPILIANYFFDSIPQDSFAIVDGQLWPNLLSLYAPVSDPDLDDLAIWEKLRLAYEALPGERPYYPHAPFYDAILDDYEATLPDTVLTLPNVGLDCLRFWQALGHGRGLLLSCDRGYTLLSSLVGQGNPLPNLHGSFSLMVNYHALGEWVARSGGMPLHAAHYMDNLQVAAYLLGRAPSAGMETRLAFADAVGETGGGGPDDIFALKQALGAAEELSLPQLLSYLRWSGWDTAVFTDCYPALSAGLQAVDPVWHPDVVAALAQVWRRHLPLRTPDPVQSKLETLLAQMALTLADLVP